MPFEGGSEERQVSSGDGRRWKKDVVSSGEILLPHRETRCSALLSAAPEGCCECLPIP